MESALGSSCSTDAPQLPVGVRMTILSNFPSLEIIAPLTIHFGDMDADVVINHKPFETLILSQSTVNNVPCLDGLLVILFDVEMWLGREEEAVLSWDQDKVDGLISSLREQIVEIHRIPALMICNPLTGSSAAAVETMSYLDCQLSDCGWLTFLGGRHLDKKYPGLRREETTPERSAALFEPQVERLQFAMLATEIARWAYRFVKSPRKVIVVDCDNTLWSGVCGEVGWSGIKLTPANMAVQRMLVTQQRAGKLICLCSKNNEQDVLQVFEQRKDMILQWADIAAHRLNWKPKVENLLELANQLNLRQDSFVFIDDDSFECDSVRELLSDVLVLMMPASADAEAVELQFQRVWDFDLEAVVKTEEDQRRGAYYRENAVRHSVLQASKSLEEFIRSLQVHVSVSELKADDLDRAVQLYQRVNQFSLNGIRWNRLQLKAKMGAGLCCAIRAGDRYGDYGLIGVLVYDLLADELIVQSMILSCRALGRGVEERVLREILDRAQGLGLSRVSFDCRATSRNEPARDFVARFGLSAGIDISMGPPMGDNETRVRLMPSR